MNIETKNKPKGRAPEEWLQKSTFNAKTFSIVIVLAVVLSFSAKNVELDKLCNMAGDWLYGLVVASDEAPTGRGISGFLSDMFPPQISDAQEISRVENLDRDNLPFFSYIEMKEVKDFTLDPDTFEMIETVGTEEYLIRPMGYLQIVGVKMLETLEIGLWGTILAILLSIPLTIWSARNYSPNFLTYSSARSVVSLFRAIPELISALILVIAFGFGPIPGILALGIHCAGFLGKFYAEDIENADKGPQDALFAIGASPLKVLWVSVLPQVFPQYIAYTLYILDRNVRMAAVVGIVGAGGIGLELKGRFEMFHYAHVGTILMVLFITVLILDQFSAGIRKKLIA